MATYQELRGLFNDSDLMEKTEVAVVVAANDLVGGTPTTADKAWIAAALANPSAEAQKALMNVLAANKGLSVAQIQNATDSALQTNVNAVVPILVDALAGV
jgi:hypothetical protein